MWGMAPYMGTPPYETSEDDYQAARDLLSAVIAAYSGCIAEAEDANELEAARSRVVEERANLTAADSSRVAEILEAFPARLAALRGRS